MRYATREGRVEARRLRRVAWVAMVAGLVWVEMYVGDAAVACCIGLCTLAYLVGLTQGME